MKANLYTRITHLTMTLVLFITACGKTNQTAFNAKSQENSIAKQTPQIAAANPEINTNVTSATPLPRPAESMETNVFSQDSSQIVGHIPVIATLVPATPVPTVVASAVPATLMPTPTVVATAYPAGCMGSQKIALITHEAIAPANIIGGLDITSIKYADVAANNGILNGFDTIALAMDASGVLIIGNGTVPGFIKTRLNEGAKIILLWKKVVNGIAFPDFNISTAHYHDGTRVNNPRIVYAKKGSNKIVDAFDPISIGDKNIFQLYSGPMGGETLCGTVSYNDMPLGGNMGAFHGFLPDNATRKGILFFVGLNYLDYTPIDFGEKFLRAHFEQPWDPTGVLSDVYNLKCAPGNPDIEVSVGKPVIYFYPKKETKVSVKVEIKGGEFVTTYPKYDKQKKGWDILARPDGTLKNLADNAEHSYIYWTGTSNALKTDLSEGFLVKGENAEKFLQEKLKAMGMLPKEYNEMIVYWLPYLERHKYSVVKFLTNEYTDIVNMDISPKPTSLLRVFMVFKEVDENTKVREQQLPKKFVRKGFSVVEWGGSELDGEWSVFH